jgi:sortase (surface protein transpeptidase)
MKKLLIVLLLIAGLTVIAFASLTNRKSNKQSKQKIEKKAEKQEKKRECKKSCIFS